MKNQENNLDLNTEFVVEFRQVEDLKNLQLIYPLKEFFVYDEVEKRYRLRTIYGFRQIDYLIKGNQEQTFQEESRLALRQKEFNAQKKKKQQQQQQQQQKTRKQKLLEEEQEELEEQHADDLDQSERSNVGDYDFNDSFIHDSNSDGEIISRKKVEKKVEVTTEKRVEYVSSDSDEDLNEMLAQRNKKKKKKQLN